MKKTRRKTNKNRKENVVDSILCKESNKCLFYNAFRRMIQSTTKNNIWRVETKNTVKE